MRHLSPDCSSYERVNLQIQQRILVLAVLAMHLDALCPMAMVLDMAGKQA